MTIFKVYRVLAGPGKGVFWFSASIVISLASLVLSHHWVALLLNMPEEYNHLTSFDQEANQIQLAMDHRCGIREIWGLWILPTIGLLMFLVGCPRAFSISYEEPAFACTRYVVFVALALVIAAAAAPLLLRIYFVAKTMAMI